MSAAAVGNRKTAENSSEEVRTRHHAVMRIVYVGLFAALSYVVFTFLQIKIYVGADATSFHLGNAVVAVGALLLGGFWGGLGGAIGMTIGDLLDPVYIFYAPKTFITKLLIGIIVGIFAHRVFKINQISERGKLVRATVISSAIGLGANIIMDPGLGYIYKRAIMGQSAAEAIFKLNLVTTSVNAGLSVIAASILYLALRAPLRKAGLLPDVRE